MATAPDHVPISHESEAITQPGSSKGWFSRKWSWARGATSTTGIDYIVAHREDVVELAADGCDVLGVGPQAARQVQAATPWFLRMFSTLSPGYHLEKGEMLLDDAFARLDKDGLGMPSAIAKRLLKQHDQLLRQHATLRAAAPQSRKASKIWMKETRNFLEDVKRSARDAQSDNLRKKLDAVVLDPQPVPSGRVLTSSEDPFRDPVDLI
ncbi:hypothetical protein C8Q76DRAFT_702835 [Earliella scabrosa]|nr:hypothetical protein C8Q76DRAFT_702835 [Earliella scabrosa]